MKAKTGIVETTLETSFYDFTSGFQEDLINSEGYEKIVFCDQPGIGGQQINRERFKIINFCYF